MDTSTVAELPPKLGFGEYPEWLTDFLYVKTASQWEKQTLTSEFSRMDERLRSIITDAEHMLKELHSPRDDEPSLRIITYIGSRIAELASHAASFSAHIDGVVHRSAMAEEFGHDD